MNQIKTKSYLWNTGNNAEEPGEGEHDPASLVRVFEAHGMNDGEVAIQADGDQDEGRQVKSERPTKHEQSAADVAGQPRHGDVPRRLQGQHDEGHDKVSHGQVHDEEVHARPTVPVPEQSDEHRQVTECSDDEENRVGDHR